MVPPHHGFQENKNNSCHEQIDTSHRHRRGPRRALCRIHGHARLRRRGRPEAAEPPRPTPASTTARARTPARARAAARPATTAARARTPARARAAAARTRRLRRRPPARASEVAFARENFSLATRPAERRPRFFSHARQPIQRRHRLRHRHRPAGAALPAHPREEAGRRLVRDHLRELHGRRRPARWSSSTRSSSSTAWCSTASRCTSARPTSPTAPTCSKLKTLVKRTKTPWLSDHLCWGSVDGTYTHDLLPDALHLRAPRGAPRRRSGRSATTSRCRSASRTSAATPSSTSPR